MTWPMGRAIAHLLSSDSQPLPSTHRATGSGDGPQRGDDLQVDGGSGSAQVQKLNLREDGPVGRSFERSVN